MHNIASLHRVGIKNTPQTQADSQGPQDLSGFLDQIVQQLKAAPATDTTSTTQKISPPVKALAAKIAETLKKDDTLPPALKNLAPDELVSKIATLLQKNIIMPAALQAKVTPDELAAKIADLLQKDSNTPVKPSLISDLAAQISAQIQAAPAIDKKDLPQKIADILSKPELAEQLDKIQPGSSDNADMQKILQQIQEQQQNTAAPVNPDILQQLKDKIAALIQNNNDISSDTLVQLKTEIIQSLKDQGLDQPAIQSYLTTLAKSLKQDDSMAADAARAKSTDNLFSAIANTVQAKSPASDTKAALPQQTASPTPSLVTELKETPKQEVPSLGQKNPTGQRPPSSADAAPSAPAQQNLTAKIAGHSVSPAMINALADSGNNGFGGANDFGTDSNGKPQDLAGTLSLLKPSTESSQNFTNYMSSARNLPNPVTQMVNIQLQRNINAKVDTMTLQLNPADLGRLDIKLKFGKDGSVKAHLTADKPETLALLQKDSHHLEKVLQQTGLDSDETSLSFDLRHQGQQQNLEGYKENNKGDADAFNAQMDGTAAEKSLQARIAVQTNGYITPSGVNIMV